MAREKAGPLAKLARPLTLSSLVHQLRRTWHLTGRWLPQGWFDALRQLALFGGAYYAYRLVRGFVDGNPGLAFENARLLVDAERAMGLFFEASLQDSVERAAPVVLDASNWMYVNSHFVVTTTFLIWLYIARNHAFYYVRNMFMVAMGLALVLYVAFPTAPPRFMPEWGFTDTVATFVGEGAESSANVLYNPYAAVPSMHVAFGLMIGLSGVRLVRGRVLSALFYVYPFWVTLVTVITANHFWVDAALGALAAALAFSLARAAARTRPEAWAFRRALPSRATA